MTWEIAFGNVMSPCLAASLHGSRTTMQDNLKIALARVRRLIIESGGLVRAIGAGRQRNAEVPWQRVELRPVSIRGARRLQIIQCSRHQTFTRHVPWGGEAAADVDGLLRLAFATWRIETEQETLQVRISKKGTVRVHCAEASRVAVAADHNRVAQRLIPATDPLWRVLGLADASGHIKPSCQDKFRQVDAFLRLLQPMVQHISPRDLRAIRVVDLGCGNATLTFAAYHYLQQTMNSPLSFVGVDVKAQARAHNERLATELGFANMSFLQGSIGAAPIGAADVVLALHACDTATDEALARAVRWHAQVILAAPCCHHHLQAQIRSHGQVPHPYGLIKRHGILLERWSDLATDALRAAVLRQRGYRVEVMEFVPSEHTPRNILLRAVLTGAPPDPATAKEIEQLVNLWGVQPRLLQLLDGTP